MATNFNPARFRMGEEASMASFPAATPAPIVDERTKLAAMGIIPPLPTTQQYPQEVQAIIDRLKNVINATTDANQKASLQNYLDSLLASNVTDIGYWTGAESTFNNFAQTLGAPTTGGNVFTVDTNTVTQTPTQTPTGAPATVVNTYTDPTTGDVIAIYSDGSTKTLSAGTKIADAAKAAADKAAADAAAAAAKALADKQAADAAAAAKKAAGQSAYDLLFSQFQQYGLGALVEPLKGFITEGLSPAEFTLRLRDTDAYKKRFAANAQRTARGLRALSEAEYIGLEDQYQNVMRQYGLPDSYYTRGDMGRQQGFEKFIAGDISPVELEDRIQTAQNRVLYAAPEVAQSLREFYPDITNGDILAYALDPEQALTNIKRKVTSAEIGAGARQAGLSTGLSRAEELQRYGVTGEQARQGFQAVAGVLPRASMLGEIYAEQGLGPYTQTVAEQEVFGLAGAPEAQRKRQRLSALEQAQFAGSSGAAQTALSRERAGQF